MTKSFVQQIKVSHFLLSRKFFLIPKITTKWKHFTHFLSRKRFASVTSHQQHILLPKSHFYALFSSRNSSDKNLTFAYTFQVFDLRTCSATVIKAQFFSNRQPDHKRTRETYHHRTISTGFPNKAVILECNVVVVT